VRKILIFFLSIRAKKNLQGPMGKDRKIQSGMDFDGDTSYRVHTKREAAGTCGK
jgi:hypothetical protein